MLSGANFVPPLKEEVASKGQPSIVTVEFLSSVVEPINVVLNEPFILQKRVPKHYPGENRTDGTHLI